MKIEDPGLMKKRRCIRERGFAAAGDEPVLTLAVASEERVAVLSFLSARHLAATKMHFRKMHFSKILQIFGGLVLGCIKTKFCNKICV